MVLYLIGVVVAAVLAIAGTAYLNGLAPEQFPGDHGTAVGGALVLSLLSWLAVATMVFIAAYLILYALTVTAARRLRPATVQVIDPDQERPR